MIDESNCIEIIVKHSKNNLDLTKQLSDEYFYQHLGLCVIDSVFSINTNYKATQNVIERYSLYSNIETFRRSEVKNSIPIKQQQKSISEFIEFLNNSLYECKCNTKENCDNSCINCHKFANDILKNLQRTSTTNGILKICAVKQFLQTLKQNKIEYFQDLHEIFNDHEKICKLEKEVRSIRGQKKGTSFKYFLMLSGKDDLIKPDRMIKSYLASILNLNEERLSDEQCFFLLSKSFQHLQNDYLTSLRQYDHIIWDYQRSKNKSK